MKKDIKQKILFALTNEESLAMITKYKEEKIITLEPRV